MALWVLVGGDLGWASVTGMARAVDNVPHARLRPARELRAPLAVEHVGRFAPGGALARVLAFLRVSSLGCGGTGLVRKASGLRAKRRERVDGGRGSHAL